MQFKRLRGFEAVITISSSIHQNTGVFRLVYVSIATSPLEVDELKAIERVAIRNNAELHVTGLLTYCDGKFMQFLEGEQADVEEIFAKIVGDGRHHSIDVMCQGIIPKRQFKDWQMKYADIHDIKENEGYIYDNLFNIGNGAHNVLEHAQESLKLLLAFKNSCPSQI